MKQYRAYTQTAFGAEKFDIRDDYENLVIIEAETAEEAEELFEEYIYINSKISFEATEKWIEENPIFVVEI